YRSPELIDQYLLSYVGALDRQQQLLGTFLRSDSHSLEISKLLNMFSQDEFQDRFTARLLKGDFSAPEIY
ncbi:hypothetical protein AB4424_25590, partial [Vibrio splendidus]